MKSYKIKTMIIFIIFSTMGLLVAQDIDSGATGTGTGLVQFCASWESTPTAADFTTMDIATYDADFLEFASVLAITDFDANYAFNITATNNGWSGLPTNYGGDKTPAGSDNDLLIAVKDINADAGYSLTPSEGLIAANGYGDYTAITNSGAVIASGGTTSHGVESATFNLDAKVLMDWITDIKGTYTVGLTLTIATQ